MVPFNHIYQFLFIVKLSRNWICDDFRTRVEISQVLFVDVYSKKSVVLRVLTEKGCPCVVQV